MSFAITITNELARKLKNHCENQRTCKYCIFWGAEGCGLEDVGIVAPCSWDLEENGGD